MAQISGLQVVQPLGQSALIREPNKVSFKSNKNNCDKPTIDKVNLAAAGIIGAAISGLGGPKVYEITAKEQCIRELDEFVDGTKELLDADVSEETIDGIFKTIKKVKKNDNKAISELGSYLKNNIMFEALSSIVDDSIKLYEKDGAKGVKAKFAELKDGLFNSIKNNVLNSQECLEEFGMDAETVKNTEPKQVVKNILDNAKLESKKRIDSRIKCFKLPTSTKISFAVIGGLAAAGIYAVGCALFGGKKADS